MLTFASSALAQTNDGGIQSNLGSPLRDALERRSREIKLRSINMTGTTKRDPREQQALLKQMNEDFREIQLIRLEMVKEIAVGKPLEYKRLANDASEIRKRTARLRSLLALVDDKETERKEAKTNTYDVNSIQDAASDLCIEISRFITNPLFNDGAVYNLRFAIEADKTLESIIKLSTNLKYSADKLRQ